MVCAYITIHIRHIYSNLSNKVVNCSYILAFLKKSPCHIITSYTHQWYRINTNKILKNHKLALCNDPAVHMVSTPPAESLQTNAFKTTARLTFSQMQNEHINSPCTQPMCSTSTSAKQKHKEFTSK